MQNDAYTKCSSLSRRQGETPFFDDREFRPMAKQPISCLKSRNNTQTPSAAQAPPKRVAFDLEMVAEFDCPENHDRPPTPIQPRPQSCLKGASRKRSHFNASEEKKTVRFNDMVKERIYPLGNAWEEPNDDNVRLRDNSTHTNPNGPISDLDDDANMISFPKPMSKPSEMPEESVFFMEDVVNEQLSEAETNSIRHRMEYLDFNRVRFLDQDVVRNRRMRNNFDEMDTAVDLSLRQAAVNSSSPANGTYSVPVNPRMPANQNLPFDRSLSFNSDLLPNNNPTPKSTARDPGRLVKVRRPNQDTRRFNKNPWAELVQM